jgi:hypothetical protein
MPQGFEKNLDRGSSNKEQNQKKSIEEIRHRNTFIRPLETTLLGRNVSDLVQLHKQSLPEIRQQRREENASLSTDHIDKAIAKYMEEKEQLGNPNARISESTNMSRSPSYAPEEEFKPHSPIDSTEQSGTPVYIPASPGTAYMEGSLSSISELNTSSSKETEQINNSPNEEKHDQQIREYLTIEDITKDFEENASGASSKVDIAYVSQVKQRISDLRTCSKKGSEIRKYYDNIQMRLDRIFKARNIEPYPKGIVPRFDSQISCTEDADDATLQAINLMERGLSYQRFTVKTELEGYALELKKQIER